MKKTILYFIITSTIGGSCQEKKKEPKEEDPIVNLQAQLHADSVVKQITHNASFDTIGINEAPVKILKARLVQEDYSSYKNVQLRFKNVSKKTIAGIKFKWYAENVFGEPADMGSIIAEGFGGGYTDIPLKAGNLTSGTWSELSRDAKKIVKAWPVEVIFQDGSRWLVGKRLIYK